MFSLYPVYQVILKGFLVEETIRAMKTVTNLETKLALSKYKNMSKRHFISLVTCKIKIKFVRKILYIYIFFSLCIDIYIPRYL